MNERVSEWVSERVKERKYWNGSEKQQPNHAESNMKQILSEKYEQGGKI